MDPMSRGHTLPPRTVLRADDFDDYARELPRAHEIPASAAAVHAGRHLAPKLRLTSLVLGCSTNKELCARFAQVNPLTLFIPQNAYKWLSGKATPRASSVYEDWAKLLGEPLSAPFVAYSSFEEFQAVLGQRFMLPQTALHGIRIEADLPSVADAPAPARVWPTSPPRGTTWFEGNYLTLSPAWSDAERGRLIVGMVHIATDEERGARLCYTEKLFGRQVAMQGQLVNDGRTAQSAITCSYTQRLFFLALNAPTPPANLIGGILTGGAIHAPDARAAACRILLLRAVAGRTEELAARLGYIDAEAGALSHEFAALGYRPDAANSGLFAGILGHLGANAAHGICEASPRDLAPLEREIDRLVAS